MGDPSFDTIWQLKDFAVLLGPGGTIVFAGIWWLERKERRAKEITFIAQLDRFIETNQRLSEALNSLRVKTGN